MKTLIILLLLLITINLSGCASVDVTYRYNPENACTGNVISLSVSLGEEVNLIRIKDGNGNILGEWTDTDTFAISDVVNEDKLQYKLRVKKEIDWWPDYNEKFYSEIYLYDDPTWSADIKGGLLGDIDPGEYAYAGDTTVIDPECEAVATDPERDCDRVAACRYEWDPIFILRSLFWQFSDNDFSNRLKVKGIENKSQSTITVLSRNIAPGDTAMFGTGISVAGFTIKHDFNPPLRYECETVSKDMLCTSNPAFTKEDHPDRAVCSGLNPIVKLYLECTE